MSENEASQIWNELKARNDITREEAMVLVEAVKVLNSKRKKYTLALVVSEQIYEGDPGGNGCWLEGEQIEWARVDDFDTRAEAEGASLKLHYLYNEALGDHKDVKPS